MKKSFCLGVAKFFVLALCAFMVSCSSVKNYKYFQDISDTARLVKIYNSSYTDPLIKTDDMLTVSIQTLDPAATSTINSGNSPLSSGSASVTSPESAGVSTPAGYLVDKNGNIQIAIIGSIHVAGLSTAQARDLVEKRAATYYNNIIVSLRLSNFRVNVLGEVARPAIYNIPTEHVTLLDALGYAGDLTIYGNRKNVLLLRKNGEGVTDAIRLDLTSSNIMKSPYFYLKQDDAIYVTPTKTKVVANDASESRSITIFATLASLFIVLITRIK